MKQVPLKVSQDLQQALPTECQGFGFTKAHTESLIIWNNCLNKRKRRRRRRRMGWTGTNTYNEIRKSL